MKPLYVSTLGLDKNMEVTTSKMGACKLSVLKCLNVLKANDPSHKKRNSNQQEPKHRLFITDAMSCVMKKLAIKSTHHEKFN